MHAALTVPMLMVMTFVPQAFADDPLRPGALSLVRAELVADVASVAPGTPFRLGVRLRMADGWHVNWINPGDAGLAPSIAWKLPDGFKAGIVQWPLPSRFPTGPLTIFGYAGEVMLMIDVRPPADLPPGGNIMLAADVSWLACAEECIPGSATLRLDLPIEKAARNAEQRASFDATEARLPRHTRAWSVDARIDQSATIVLEVQDGSGKGAALEGVFFFPYEPGLIENAEPQTMSMHTGPAGQSVFELRITRARIPAGSVSNVEGVLVATSGLGEGTAPAAIEINVPVNQR
jgi:DsbC/DsbD-like thiol-disulfide interchange protein